MRCDSAANQPAEETARSISGVGCKPLRLQIKATLGAVEHRLGGLNLVIGTRWRRFNVDNDCVLGIEEIIEPIAELHAFCWPWPSMPSKTCAVGSAIMRV